MTVTPCPVVVVAVVPPPPSTTPCNVARYSGADGIVQKPEAVQAVVDFMGGLISKQCAIDVVLAFFAQTGDSSLNAQIGIETPATAANITAVSMTANSQNPGAITLIVHWKNTGTAAGSFVPKVSIDGTVVDLNQGSITLQPGETKIAGWLTLEGIGAGSKVVCPVPN